MQGIKRNLSLYTCLGCSFVNTPAVISWKSYLGVPFQRAVKSSDECSLCWQAEKVPHEFYGKA